MSIGTTARFSFAWYRRTEFLVLPTPLLALIVPSIDKCPQHDALVEVKVTGPVLTGQVELLGTVDGLPDSELLSYDANTPGSVMRVSCTRGLCVTSLEVTGFDPGCTIQARYVGASGGGIHTNCLLVECLPGHREYAGRGTWKATIPGPQEGATAWIAFDDLWNYRPRPGDVFVELEQGETEGRRWEVTGRPDYVGPFMPSHWECDVKLHNRTDVQIRPAP